MWIFFIAEHGKLLYLAWNWVRMRLLPSFVKNFCSALRKFFTTDFIFGHCFNLWRTDATRPHRWYQMPIQYNLFVFLICRIDYSVVSMYRVYARFYTILTCLANPNWKLHIIPSVSSINHILFPSRTLLDIKKSQVVFGKNMTCGKIQNERNNDNCDASQFSSFLVIPLQPWAEMTAWNRVGWRRANVKSIWHPSQRRSEGGFEFRKVVDHFVFGQRRRRQFTCLAFHCDRHFSSQRKAVPRKEKYFRFDWKLSI